MTTPQPPTLIGNLFRGSGNDSENLDIIFSFSTTQPNMGSFSYPANKKNIFNEYSRSFTFICDIWAIYVNFRNGNIKNIVGDTSIVNIPYTEFAFKQSWDHNMETYQWNALDFSRSFDYASMITHLAELGNITSALSMISHMTNMSVIDLETIHCLRDDITMFFQSIDLKLSLAEFKQIPRAVMGKPLLKRLGKEIPKKEEDFPVCVICMDNIKSRQHCTVLNCGHLYHLDCAKQWFTKHCEKPTCPCCRAEVQVTRDSIDQVVYDDIDWQPGRDRDEIDLVEPPYVARQLNFDDIESDDDSGYDSMPPLIDEEGNEIDDDIPDEELMEMMDRVEANLLNRNVPPENVSEQTTTNTEPIPLSSLVNFTQDEIDMLDEEIWNTLVRIDMLDEEIWNTLVRDNHSQNIPIDSIHITPRSNERTHNMIRRGPSTNV